MPQLDWTQYLRSAMQGMLAQPCIEATTDPAHTKGTPDRVVRLYQQVFWGCEVDAASTLNTLFPSRRDEMVSLYDMDFLSWCSHHLLPFYGKAHFAYIPNGNLVGLSKIPRLIEALAARPQVQEVLTDQICAIFDNTVKPYGVAVCLDAVHSCMFARGVRKLAITRTTALRGAFLEKPHAKEEFFAGIERIRR